jgi:hypothetical protein
LVFFGRGAKSLEKNIDKAKYLLRIENQKYRDHVRTKW